MSEPKLGKDHHLHLPGDKGTGNDGEHITRTVSAPDAPIEHRTKVPRGHPHFISPDGQWKGTISNHHAIGHPVLQHFIHPPGRIEGHHGDDWHHRLNRYLHSFPVQVTLNTLLLVDVILIITGIQLEILFLESEIEDYKHGCEAQEACPSHPGNESLDEAFRGVEFASLAILFVFAIDNFLLMLANGWAFFKNPLYVLDTVVVLAAIVFETVLRSTFAGGLVILARTWRFVRIGHGVFETSETLQEYHHKEHKEAEKGGGREKDAHSSISS
mmetsp:Transcript_17521/g.24518  ORF Transcript_17521/g.24518 Transcript_17521/m.24518 type:complete len:271 (-) Transcript_17521:230-1042(-)